MTEHDWQPIRSYDLTVESECLKLAQKLFVRYLEDRVESNEKARTRLIAGIQVALDHARISGAGQPMPANPELAGKLMTMAARRSVETSFGWSHPDCEALEQAARILRGEPEVVADDDRVGAVLSD